MSQNSNILYINFLKKAGISSFLQDKPNIFYKHDNNKNIQNINNIENLDDLNLFIKKKIQSQISKYF